MFHSNVSYIYKTPIYLFRAAAMMLFYNIQKKYRDRSCIFLDLLWYTILELCSFLAGFPTQKLAQPQVGYKSGMMLVRNFVKVDCLFKGRWDGQHGR
jgi:hypothetical protein